MAWDGYSPGVGAGLPSKLPGLSDFLPFQGPASAAFQVVDSDPAGIDEMLRTRGTTVEYRKSIACPCARTQSGRARTACPVCGGRGYAYPPDLRIPDLRVGLTGRNDQRRDGVVSGQVRVTFPTNITPQRGDLLMPLGQVHTIDEVVVHSNVELHDLASLRDSDLYDVPDVSVRGDVLRYPDVIRVLAIRGWDGTAGARYLRSVGAQSVGSLLPGQLEAFYAVALPDMSTCATVVGNIVQWAAGKTPAPGYVYSVKYEARAVYFISEDPAARMDGNTRVPFNSSTAIRYDALGQDDGQELR